MNFANFVGNSLGIGNCRQNFLSPLESTTVRVRALARVATSRFVLARSTLNSFGKRLIESIHNSFLLSLYIVLASQILARSTLNSFEKRLIESILQLSTLESLPL